MILEPLSDDEKLTRKEREELSKKHRDVVQELDKLSKDIKYVVNFRRILETCKYR